MQTVIWGLENLDFLGQILTSALQSNGSPEKASVLRSLFCVLRPSAFGLLGSRIRFLKRKVEESFVFKTMKIMICKCSPALNSWRPAPLSLSNTHTRTRRHTYLVKFPSVETWSSRSSRMLSWGYMAERTLQDATELLADDQTVVLIFSFRKQSLFPPHDWWIPNQWGKTKRL